MKILSAAIVVFLFSPLLSGCGDGVVALSLTVACSPTAILTTGTSTCSATLLPQGVGGSAPLFTWTATNGTISSSGVFSPSGVGTTTITATASITTPSSTSQLVGSATISVAAPPKVTSVSVVCTPSSILTTATSSCSATVSGTGGPAQAVTWTATNGIITNGGIFSPSGPGISTITATSAQDPTKSGAATVTITAVSTVTSVAVTCTPSSILTTSTSTCSQTVLGTGSPSQSVTWSASNGTVTSAGVFTPTSAGTATITATSTQDISKSGFALLAVSVPPTITSVTAVCAPPSILTAQTATCTSTVTGAGNYSNAVNWLVNGIAGGNSTVGTIGSSGLYTAPVVVPAQGNSIAITGISQQDPSKSATAGVSLFYPAPVLAAVSPAAVLAGSSDTGITLTGSNFTPLSVANFNGQALATSFISSAEITATVPQAMLSVPTTGVVNVVTPSPGGGTSSAAAFAINPIVAVSNLVILATPVYGGSPDGPWLLTVAASDSSGNAIPNVPVTLQATEGSITQNGAGSTDSNGSLTAAISPPSTYTGEAVTVAATGGGQTAIVNIAFVGATTSIQQEAIAAAAHFRSAHPEASSFPRDSSASSGSSAPPLQQVIIGESGSTNPFLKSQADPTRALCYSNAQLDTTIPVNCQTVFSTDQVYLSPSNPSASACKQLQTYIGIGSCIGAGLVAVACASPETGGGAVICAGAIESGTGDALAGNCAGFLAGLVSKAMAGNSGLKDVAGETTINIVGLVQDTNSTNPIGISSNLIGMACNTVDAASLGHGPINVTPSTATLSLGKQQSFSADSDVTWSVMSDAIGDHSFGTITPTDSRHAVYTAPATYPEFCGFVTGSCGITIVCFGFKCTNR